MSLFWRRKKDEDKTRLPPRQRWIDHILGWGTEHPGIVPTLPDISKDEWSLEIEGEVEKPLTMDWEGFMQLPQTTSVSDFHCVETWSVKDQKWEGVLFKEIMSRVKPTSKARYVILECYDGYSTSLPIDELTGEDIILAHRLNDEDLHQPLGGPMRLIVPHKYAYKSPMWLKKIIFDTRDKLGYWERGIYSNTADPWKNDRTRLR
ncbi:molybdopterin-dependent oxidoreductase [Candidatus Bathyarchaeota archaeon]|nr:molybdopterin-dependent oxidoreductase [Candidatus Bathyarchaeota archaeon]